MPCAAEARTHEKTMNSFSRPWNASTLATSMPLYSALLSGPICSIIRTICSQRTREARSVRG